MVPRTNVYVDGYNLYYSLRRRAEAKGVPHTEYRWLDIVGLARWLLPDDNVGTVRYFTSPVKGKLDNEAAASRQEIFIRALETRGDVIVVRGKFQRNTPHLQVHADPAETVKVIDWKEKRSDVALASLLLRDAYESQCTRAALISSDSDFVPTVEIARRRLPHGIVVLNPNVGHARQLMKASGFDYLHIPEQAFRESQLPKAVLGKDKRRVERPDGW